MRLRLYHHHDGARVAYRETGTGQAIILLHSLGLSHREWEPIVDALSARFRVVVPDLPLHGDSEDRPRHPLDPDPLRDGVTRVVGAVAGMGLLTMQRLIAPQAISATVLGLALRNRSASDSIVPSIATGVLGLFAIGAASAVARWWPQRADMLGGFGWISVPLLAVSLGAGAPGALGAAHLFITALAAGALTCGIAVLTQRHVYAAATIVTLCALGGVIAAARMWQPIPAQWLGMCTLVILLFLLTLAPTIALWAARIRPPYFGSVTGRDLFRRSAAGGRGRRGGAQPGHHPTRSADCVRCPTREQRADRDLRGRGPDAARRRMGHPDAGSAPQ